MGRLLDLIFPERVYRREQRELEKERMHKRLDGFDLQLDNIRNILIKTSASHARRDKAADEVLTKILFRFDELEGRQKALEGKLDEIGKKLDALATSGNLPGGVSAKQILSEYIYGERGDE